MSPIDQFTAREACTVLASLRLFQLIQQNSGAFPLELVKAFEDSGWYQVCCIKDMEHFETEEPLDYAEIDRLCERIEVDFNR